MNATKTGRHPILLGGAHWREHALPLGGALLVGAILRLLWLGDTSFLGDQAELLALGRSAADFHAIIITGIPSSIGTLNPPASAWLYAPFALVGGPLGAALFTALANIVAIALLYSLAARYFDRVAACMAALLYATASGPVHFSRFIWQQNLLAPVVLGFIWLIALAVVERRRGWLGWSVLLWGIATELHPTAAPLLGLIALALALTWRELRRRDILWAAAASLALFGPTLLWEFASHGADLRSVERFTQGHATLDTKALSYLVQLIQPAPPAWYGSGASYVAVGQALISLGWLMAALLVAAEVWLLWSLLAPWLRQGFGPLRTLHGLRDPLTEALGDARWRLTLTLTLWQAIPLLFMMRHSRPIEAHYLLVLLPGVYLSISGFLAWARGWPLATPARRTSFTAISQATMTTALLVAGIALAGAQTFGVVAELATIHSGAFDGLAMPLHYGVPLASQQKALDQTQAAAQRLSGASVAIASTSVQQESLGYLSATSTSTIPATTYVSESCVALPAANATGPLVTLALPGSDAARLLPDVTSARKLGAIPVQGDTPYQLYAISPGARIADERTIATPATSTTLPRPVAYAYASSAQASLALTIRWTGAPVLATGGQNAVSYWYGADPRGAPIANFTFTFQPLDAHDAAIGEPLTTTCARFAWSRSLSLITLTALPAALRTNPAVAAWRITAEVAPAQATRPAFGPLALESGVITFGPPTPLAPATTFAAPPP